MGLHTDAGSEETYKGLATELHSSRRFFLAIILVVTYYLHAMNRMMMSPCKKYFGEGRISNRIVIQLLHAFYALQK